MLLLVQAALLPVYGPWLDAHYAGRQPAHRHVYLGGVHVDHVHSLDRREAIRSFLCLPLLEQEEGSTISLPDQDVAGRMVALFLPLLVPGQGLPTDRPGNLSFRLLEDYVSLQAIYLPPPEEPPRLSYFKFSKV